MRPSTVLLAALLVAMAVAMLFMYGSCCLRLPRVVRVTVTVTRSATVTETLTTTLVLTRTLSYTATVTVEVPTAKPRLIGVYPHSARLGDLLIQAERCIVAPAAIVAVDGRGVVLAPEEGFKLVLVEVNVTNLGSGNASISSLDLAVATTSGSYGEASPPLIQVIASGNLSELKSRFPWLPVARAPRLRATLGSGESLVGWHVFAVQGEPRELLATLGSRSVAVRLVCVAWPAPPRLKAKG